MVCVIVVMTALIGSQIPRLETDPTLDFAIWKDSPAYSRYLQFTEEFGNLIVDAREGAYKSADAGKNVDEVEKALKDLKEVVSLDSPPGLWLRNERILWE